MIIPALQDDALLADIASAPGEESHLWWLGQSGYLVKSGGVHLLVDPYLSDSLTRKYAGTDKEHVRMTERCLAPEALASLSPIVFSSHAHTDHLDPETLVPLAHAMAARGETMKLVLSPANILIAKGKLGEAPVDYLPLDAGGAIRLGKAGEITVEAIASAHPDLARNNAGEHLYLGFVFRLGKRTLYHSGDTLWHAGLSEALLAARPDTVLLPINGNEPARGVAGNLNGIEAAALARACGAALAIPHHYDMFTFNTALPDEFAATCRRLGQPFLLPRCGERITLR
ncbi:L-ascorbate metabolism protein UlaG, beta-lactamase superfamily [Verrucomicrobium sp. GAS474]|uniref:MBL fold metallo-hydrolase n=1 Tax=Verrucomicrobium sp. GAS474 TaxID=1882831 RepID=UPI00087C9719|nr:MBL fold metallo-hydrolase [Verrucomicrobium sp. GAS474]SDT98799.1 L-ascorbate metabolism protein UlaG, beta-lactamase superfamily [Verrucomicrobium sp. GAS474]